MNTHLGLIGKKLGCTQVFDSSGNVSRVTVIEAGPCVVVRKRSVEKDGYVALQVAFGERRAALTTKPMQGYYEKNGVTPRTVTNKRGREVQMYPRHLRELRVTAEDAARFEVGATISVADVFQPGQFVDVSGTSKGRGFAGVFKRHHFAGMVSTHGTHEYFRHGGSIGTNMTPGRTMPGKKMPGHLGAKRSTILNQKVVSVDTEQNLVLVEGSVPGPNNGLVSVRGAVKQGRHA